MVFSATRATAAVGLIGIGAVHALWAVGSSWPARDRKQLADAVVGSLEMPPPAACAVVAAGLAGAGALVAGASGNRRPAIAARRLVGLGLIARGAAGGVATGKLLRLPSPGPRFRALDSRYYRPLCSVLGAAALVSARIR